MKKSKRVTATTHPFMIKSLSILLLASSSAFSLAADEGKFLPLPDEVSTGGTKQAKEIKIEDILEHVGENKPQFAAQLPDALSVDSEGAEINYNHDEGSIHYHGEKHPIRVITDLGTEMNAYDLLLNIKNKEATFNSNFYLYHGDSLTLGHYGHFNWENNEAQLLNLRTKINGILIKAESASFKKDKNGVEYVELSNTHLSTHDIEQPDSWIGFRKMRVYPGSHAELLGLSLGRHGQNSLVPILGWIPLSHSLNPREGYLPMPGSKSIWGAYLLNQYGFLIGDRRVEKGKPTSDYLLTSHVDYRSRRGFGFGIDLENLEKTEKHANMTGMSLYYIPDSDPNISPTTASRTDVDPNRYRFALQSMWNLDELSSSQSTWRLKANINVLSDQYVLADYFEDLSEVNDKPDNTLALTNRGRDDEASLLLRLAINDFYTTDERLEGSYYRVRQPLLSESLFYETRNSLGVLRQSIPIEDRLSYLEALANTTNSDIANYYKRLLNGGSYMRANSIQEFSSNLKVLDFLNLTPKAGLAYTGYYGVDDVGADNRFNAYLALDFDFKFHRKYKSIRSSQWGIDGITHTIHPYTTISHNSINSSDALVPQIDSWTSALGGSSNNPMPLDLCGFVGPDGWSNWTIVRTGVQNSLNTVYDGDKFTLLRWNTFINWNIDNPVSYNTLSNLYSSLTLKPTRRLTLNSEAQFPFYSGGDEFSQYNHTLSYLVNQWLELGAGHRYINDHPIQSDANQISSNINIRFNENYSLACRWYFDCELDEMPIQQYAIFRNTGAWQVGATLFLRNNGGNRETGFGLSFTLRETATSLPVNFF